MDRDKLTAIIENFSLELCETVSWHYPPPDAMTNDRFVADLDKITLALIEDILAIPEVHKWKPQLI
jgi:hypothetical protein